MKVSHWVFVLFVIFLPSTNACVDTLLALTKRNGSSAEAIKAQFDIIKEIRKLHPDFLELFEKRGIPFDIVVAFYKELKGKRDLKNFPLIEQVLTSFELLTFFKLSRDKKLALMVKLLRSRTGKYRHINCGHNRYSFYKDFLTKKESFEELSFFFENLPLLQKYVIGHYEHLEKLRKVVPKHPANIRKVVHETNLSLVRILNLLGIKYGLGFYRIAQNGKAQRIDFIILKNLNQYKSTPPVVAREILRHNGKYHSHIVFDPFRILSQTDPPLALYLRELQMIVTPVNYFINPFSLRNIRALNHESRHGRGVKRLLDDKLSFDSFTVHQGTQSTNSPASRLITSSLTDQGYSNQRHFEEYINFLNDYLFTKDINDLKQVVEHYDSVRLSINRALSQLSNKTRTHMKSVRTKSTYLSPKTHSVTEVNRNTLFVDYGTGILQVPLVGPLGTCRSKLNTPCFEALKKVLKEMNSFYESQSSTISKLWILFNKLKKGKVNNDHPEFHKLAKILSNIVKKQIKTTNSKINGVQVAP